MARKRRLESSDGLYHVINRGNYRADIFGTEGASEWARRLNKLTTDPLAPSEGDERIILRSSQ